ncbi:MAG: peptidylprolyl isomerase [Candidatus Sericytochromatia bacterium]|nr:peptidylprolyl isomerase [Candidatus Sericytochromatia bacterium]
MQRRIPNSLIVTGLALALALPVAAQPALAARKSEPTKATKATKVTKVTKAPVTEESEALAAVSKAAGKKVVLGRRVELKTTKGTLVVGLFEKDAPRTTDNFLRLVRKGFYDNTPFHRVIEGFVAQGGDPTGTGTGGPGHTLAFEKTPLKHIPGAIGMARSASLDSAGSQFFIDFVALPQLDITLDAKGKPNGGYVVFGQVIGGQATLAKLTRTMNSNNAPIPGIQPDRIIKARVL